MRLASRTVAVAGFILSIGGWAAAGPASGRPIEAAPVPAPFEQMKKLAGDWTGEDPEGKLSASYAVQSAGSAVVETLHTEHGDMVTVYHADGRDAMLTHYCASGNQPRMRAKAGDGKTLAFEFVDATNLPSADAVHMHALKVTFEDDDHFVQQWTMSAGGKESPMTLRFTRKK